MSLYRCCNKLASADDVRVLSGQSGRDVIATSRLDVETETEMFFEMLRTATLCVLRLQPGWAARSYHSRSGGVAKVVGSFVGP